MLRQFPEFLEFINPGAAIEDEHLTTVQFDNSQSTPEEILEASYQEIRQTLVQELLQKIKTVSPSFFERLVIELLIKMGYGGSFRDAGRATRLTNDGGIDGIIKKDKLGLDIIYIQAKRWDNQVVGRPEIQSFVGALDGQRANKGIFITTSYFSNSAIEFVGTTTKKVVLIDGVQLAKYMIDYSLGVSTFSTY
jgi:restriction system protein